MSEETTPGRPGLAPEDAALLDRVATWLTERRLSVPSVLFLESVKPLSFVGSQALYFLEPLVKAVISGDTYTRFAGLMENRENVEELLHRIETAADRGRDAAPDAKTPR